MAIGTTYKEEEVVKAIAIGNDDYIIAKRFFAECSLCDCPYYINRAGKDCCKKVEIEERGGRE